MKKILVMEDDPSIREGYITFLEFEGYTVFAVSDGKQGLQILETEPIDLIVSDGAMPGMTGYEALLQIKTNPRFLHIPFILATGSPPQEVREMIADQMPDLHLNKPVKPQELLKAIADLLED